MNGVLIDGPAAGTLVECGDPPRRRGIIVAGDTAFAEDAYRYYLRSIDANQATYTYGGQVAWPPEARSQITRRLTDAREPIADHAPRGALLNGE